jgi:cell division protein FtsI (penicillin-binding protein 3)
MGSHRFGRRLVRDTKPYGLLDLRGIITHSSNIGMGIIAHRMGNEVLYETVRRFGFGRRTGIECPGESAGVVYPLSRWTSYSTTSVPTGYELLVTPLQLINAFAAIVNDGILMKPRLVKKLLGPDGEVLQSFDAPVILGRATSSEVARYVAQELLVSVVENGGGHRAKTGPYRVLGKTGTAKLAYPDRGGYQDGAFLGLFVGAAPALNPQVVAMAMIRRPNPDIGYYGGKVAAPVVGEILAKTLAYLEVPPDKPAGASSL